MATELSSGAISSILEAVPGIATVLRSPIADAIVNLSRAAAGAIPFDPNLPLPPGISPDESWLPVRLVATGRLIPELGESITTGEQKAINLLAVQIVSMMEKPW